jgi:alpha-tubulin suppressor-like RCC1 family protein
LGNNTLVTSKVPVVVSGLAGAVTIAAGHLHSCATLSNGTAKCWGRNNEGQLGNNTTTDAKIPVVVSGLTNAVAISVGAFHSCATVASGIARCWVTTATAASATTTPPIQTPRHP